MPPPSERERNRSETQTETDETRSEAVCPECGGPLIHDEEHGETVCETCGLVVTEAAIDHGPEWRSFTAEETEERSRVGAPTTTMLHDKGLTTEIDWQDKDADGRVLSPKRRQQMARLRTWDERVRTKNAKERNLRQALSEIKRMASALGLPDPVREMTSVIYRRALEENLVVGRSIEGVATAALYAAARETGTPRSLDEMTVVSRVDRTEISRTYRYIARELDLGIDPADPTDYLPRFASDLNLPEETERHARDLLEAATDVGLHSGKSPVGMAAAAIYAAGLLTDHEVTQRQVSEVTGKSEVTIRNRYQELLDLAENRPSRS